MLVCVIYPVLESFTCCRLRKYNTMYLRKEIKLKEFYENIGNKSFCVASAFVSLLV